MDDTGRTVQPLRRRHAIWSAIVAGGAGVLGAILARPLVGAFHDSASWVLPAMVAGILAALVLLALLFLPWVTHRASRTTHARPRGGTRIT
jgi:MFS family permease